MQVLISIETADELRNLLWSGATRTADELFDFELENILEILAEETGGLTDVALNDMFWFEQDWIAEILGWEDWEDLTNHLEERQATADGE